MMGAFGSVIAIIFGILWTGFAIGMGAPSIFGVFGALFVLLGIVQFAYNLKNATGKDRFSVFDITSSNEEPDPLNQRFGRKDVGDNIESKASSDTEFCPYCGTKLNEDFLYCTKCGRKLPK